MFVNIVSPHGAVQFKVAWQTLESCLASASVVARLSRVRESGPQNIEPWNFREMLKHTLFVVWIAARCSLRRWISQALMHVLASCLLVSSPAFTSVSIAADNVLTDAWYSSFEKAMQQSKERGVPIVIHFHAHWCGPCRTMDSEVLETVEVRAALRAGIVGVKVNADDRKDLVSRFGVSVLPTDVIISPDGLILSKNIGSPGRTAYVARLTQFSALKNAPTNNTITQTAATSGRVVVSRSTVTVSATTIRDTARAEARTKALRRESENHFGLHGFSPVSLTESETWQPGASQYRYQYQGVSYQLASEEEFNRFKASPEKFVPALHGCDPVALVNDQVVQAGHIELGVTWRSKVYFFYSQATRDEFLRNPEKFVRVNNLTFVSGETQS